MGGSWARKTNRLLLVLVVSIATSCATYERSYKLSIADSFDATSEKSLVVVAIKSDEDLVVTSHFGRYSDLTQRVHYTTGIVSGHNSPSSEDDEYYKRRRSSKPAYYPILLEPGTNVLSKVGVRELDNYLVYNQICLWQGAIAFDVAPGKAIFIGELTIDPELNVGFNEGDYDEAKVALSQFYNVGVELELVSRLRKIRFPKVDMPKEGRGSGWCHPSFRKSS